MPNEIFTDLKGSISSGKHVAFAYTYYCYIDLLYRYCMYHSDRTMTQAEIKADLGISQTEKRLDYIIKKGGILEQMGYIETITDYPLSWNLDEGYLQFETQKEYKQKNKLSDITIISQNTTKVKYPVKSFHRTDESRQERLLDGTYYELPWTHEITYENLRSIVSDPELGYMGFYIYGYIKSKNGLAKRGYQISARQAKDELGISKNTFLKYAKKLEERKYLLVKRGCKEDRESNSYIAKS